MITIPPCILIAHDPLPRMRAAYGQELGSHCDLLFLPHLAPADRAAARARARVLIAQNPRVEITAGDVAAMTSLGFVQLLTAGVDHVPLHLFPRDVPIASNAGTFAGPMAEFALAMTLAAAKRLPVEHQEMREGRFNQFVPNKTLDGAVCAILGFGGVGRAGGAAIPGVWRRDPRHQPQRRDRRGSDARRHHEGAGNRAQHRRCRRHLPCR